MDDERIGNQIGLERVSSLLEWWGGPNNLLSNEVLESTGRLQSLLVELQSALNEGSRRRWEALVVTNTEVTLACGDLLQSRRPEDVIAAQSRIVRCWLNGLSTQAKEWMSLAQEVQACCAPMLSVPKANVAVPRASAEPLKTHVRLK